MPFQQIFESHPLATILISVVLFIVGLEVYKHLRDKKRREALSEFAKRKGFLFRKGGALLAPEDDAEDTSDVEDTDGERLKGELTKLFTMGSDRAIHNIMSNPSDGDERLFFDYSYTASAGKSRTTYIQTVACFVPEGKKFPVFSMRPEWVLDKLLDKDKDINFENCPEFSKRYFLNSDDEEGVRKLFDDSILKMFERTDKLSVESNGVELFIFKDSTPIKPENMENFIRDTGAVYDILAGRAS